MNFLNRLKYYLIGVGLGILIVLAIFKDRKLTNWTPGNQVKNEISEGSLQISPKAACQLQCLELDQDELKHILENGDVEFSESEVSDQKNRQYEISLEAVNFTSATILIQDSIITLVQLETVKDCSCE